MYGCSDLSCDERGVEDKLFNKITNNSHICKGICLYNQLQRNYFIVKIVNL